MNEKHTSPPWTATRGEYGDRPEQYWPWIIEDWWYRRIAILTDRWDETAEADARLMAAAPDLLEACDEADTAFAVCNICDGLTPQARGAIRVAWAAVNAAMSKATGKPDRFAEANADQEPTR